VSAPGEARGAAAYVLPLYTLTLFLSAFLLFAVQPMFTKMVLPLLGGSAAVWNTAVVFFQATLLLGYLYAHLSTRLLGLRRQTWLHGAVLVFAFTALPIGVASGWTPPAEGLQIPWLIGLLAVSIGLPFFAVSATAPLLQKWFAHTDHPAAGDPYFLYGGSNLGSLAALLSYPFLVEPVLGLRAQGIAWTLGYALLVAAIGTCAAILWRRYRAEEAAGAANEPQGLLADVTWKLRARWLALSVVPSALLLGVTLHVGTDIAAVPFLWVLPLALYLFTFVLVFARRPLFSARWMLHAQVVFVALVAIYYRTSHVAVLLVLHIGAMFFTAMVCHGDLARLRPTAKHLTEFYLWMSVGGVVGGLFAGIVAPLVFDDVYEYPIALILGLLLRPLPAGDGRLAAAVARWTGIDRAAAASRDVARLWRAQRWALDVALPALLLWLLLENRWRDFLGDTLGWLVSRYPGGESLSLIGAHKLLFWSSLVLFLLWLAGRPLRAALGFLAVLFVLTPELLGKTPEGRLLRERSFFGVYSVNASALRKVILPDGRTQNEVIPSASGPYHMLMNGTVIHGGQNLERPLGPITYYFREGPVGQFIDIVKESPAPGRRMGVIGLGVGVMACYLTHDQRLTYFEIDPLDERIARDPRYFTYLSNAGDKVDVVIGDGRLSLAEEPDGAFDVIVVAAFSGDAIPVHLLTREAFALYIQKLSEHGLLLLNITNGFLDLMPVVGNLVADADLAARYSAGVQPTITIGASEADWVVVARKSEMLARFGWVTPPWPVLEPDPSVDLWTDDFSNVFQVLRWRQREQVSAEGAEVSEQ
jgi:hypothetical protein